MRFLAGFDGGGTGARLRITTLDGEIVGRGQGGSANIATDPELAWRSLVEAFAAARQGLPGDASLSGAAGLAGAEVPEALGRFLALRPVEMPELTVVTDARSTCLGAHGGADGAVAAIGTGSFAYALITGKNGEVQTRRVGGWGFPQGDEGSGAWIGRQAVSAMLQAHDGRIMPDALTRHCWAELLGRGDPLSWAIGQKATGFATLAPVVVEAARAGSERAEAILTAAAEEVDRHVEALVRAEGFEALPLCLLGGLGSVLEPRLSPQTRGRLRAPQGDSVDGALLLARQAHQAMTEGSARRSRPSATAAPAI